VFKQEPDAGCQIRKPIATATLIQIWFDISKSLPFQLEDIGRDAERDLKPWLAVCSMLWWSRLRVPASLP